MGRDYTILCRMGPAHQIRPHCATGLLGYGIYLPKTVIREIEKRFRSFFGRVVLVWAMRRFLGNRYVACY
ncbi:UNVERIFIED_CONTAM: hypothetical protein Slati_2470800 [Sesamum latifolium]|uniref:Uncharacterized protein n=1 Tax=Sesamum latifolium TaxID=2727402 RepID=A0AAW2WEV5_9LAMI